MAKLIRDKRTGIYYTEDKKYEITKGSIGWNVSELDEFFKAHRNIDIYRYSFTCNTLKEVKESL